MNLPKDDNESFFTRPSFWLSKQEYRKVISEINQIYESQYKGLPVATHTTFGIDGMVHTYWFENHGFNNYNIFLRTDEM